MKEFLLPLIQEAGAIAADYFDKGVVSHFKTNKADLITAADLSVNEFLITQIQKAFPDHHIYSEELATDINHGHEFQWVIDPIDGTRNFANGISSWCVMVAILQHGQPILSAVYQPIVKELFHAEANAGAFLNNELIHVNKTNVLDHALGILCCDQSGVELKRYRQAMHNYIETSGWLHNHGTMLSACHLAAGSIDFLINNYGHIHDYWPVYLICQEAGATITNSHGQPWTDNNRDIVIANPQLHVSVLRLFETERSESIHRHEYIAPAEWFSRL